MYPNVILKPGKEKPLLRRHPWVFSGAIQKINGSPEGGDLVLISTSDGRLLGYAGFSPQSQIRCRMWRFSDQLPDNLETDLLHLLEERIRKANSARLSNPSLSATNAYRVIHAESDQIPGLVVDKYSGQLVVQFLSYGVEKWQDEIVKILIEDLQPEMIYERSDAEVRKLEGLPEKIRLLYGIQSTDELVIEENGIKFGVMVESGHKTGFYLDQRENRKMIRDYVKDKDVLDCFCYSGGFTLNAARAKARSITAVDQSGQALESLRKNLSLNSLDVSLVDTIQDDVFQRLRKFRDEGKFFDVIILDPPKFAPTRSQAQKAARGYKDINLLAAKLLRPGGILFTFSCSGGIDSRLFQQIIAGAASDAGVDLQIIQKMGQGSDHPILLSFPEGEYLKGLICQAA